MAYCGHSISDLAKRLDVTIHSLYAWIKKYGPDSKQQNELSDAQAKIRRLQKELKRTTQERDLQKKAAAYFAKHSNLGMPLSKNSDSWPVRWLCKMFDVHPSVGITYGTNSLILNVPKSSNLLQV